LTAGQGRPERNTLLIRAGSWTSIPPMNRPTRQRTHLLEKIQRKETRSLKKPGKRTKRWRKWAESYKAIAGEG
jgi:hypothetical protein